MHSYFKATSTLSRIKLKKQFFIRIGLPSTLKRRFRCPKTELFETLSKVDKFEISVDSENATFWKRWRHISHVTLSQFLLNHWSKMADELLITLLCLLIDYVIACLEINVALYNLYAKAPSLFFLGIFSSWVHFFVLVKNILILAVTWFPVYVFHSFCRLVIDRHAAFQPRHLSMRSNPTYFFLLLFVLTAWISSVFGCIWTSLNIISRQHERFQNGRSTTTGPYLGFFVCGGKLRFRTNVSTRNSPTKSSTMLEKKSFPLAGATLAGALCTALYGLLL